ncbi:hypothetical protein ACROYT_G015521 [Oculina patagonica]
MASTSKRSCVYFTAEEVADICARGDSDVESDIDSNTGGISSGEEFELNQELEGNSDSEGELSDPESAVNPEVAASPSSDQAADEVSDSDSSADEVSDSDYSPEEPARPSGRGRGRGQRQQRAAMGGGRGRGRGRGRGARPPAPPGGGAPAERSYNDRDTPNQIPPFTPRRQPGLHLNVPLLRGAMTRAVDFFRLFFTAELVRTICTHTNSYAWGVIGDKPYYGDKDGAWVETSPEEIEKLIALILYCGLVNVSSFHRYWSTKTLYHGLWARKIMARDRFKALMAVLHVVDPSDEDEGDKLRKVSSFLEFFKDRCKALYQPFQHVAVDERMVKSKHRSGIRQYIRNKPTKWGIKLWVLADSVNGYTCDFDVYIGRHAGHLVSANGLGYDVVMNLVAPLINQGYHLYFDNFYTSVKLVKDLFRVLIPATGTSAENRRGFPESMKKGPQWAQRKERGSMRWERDGVCLAQQWKDNRPVTILTSIDNANDFVMVARKEKAGNAWRNINVRQPKAIDHYNNYMNGVDRSDQIISKNCALRKCMRWWKTLFFHMIDIAIVNSYILFQLHRKEHPDEEALKRPQKFAIAEYREELVRQLAGLEEYGQPPVFKPQTKDPGEFVTDHIPRMSGTKRNCKVCYATTGKEMKVRTFCSAEQCKDAPLHITQDKNCFEIWHSKDYPHRS